MIETFIALLAAHLISDFPMQPRALVERKRNPLILVGHTLIVIAITILILGSAPLLLVAILAVTHLAMDAVKTWFLPDRLWAFALDQLVHLAVLVGLAAAWPALIEAGWWAALAGGCTLFYMVALVLVSGLIVNVQIGAIVIRLAVSKLDPGPMDSGLPNGGFLIGCLERLLIMILVFMGQPGGVGFLIAAKSILRFGEIQKNERKLSEYIIIGTFMSFGWGLTVSALTYQIVSLWLSPLRYY